jgi:hypothetical protein
MAAHARYGRTLKLLGFLNNFCLAEDENGNLWICEWHSGYPEEEEAAIFRVMQEWYFIPVQESRIKQKF